MFPAVERMIAFRYLRARRREGFISVIAGFSFLGIALGVATLIVVMAVMNGFRIELTKKILGVTGHITVSSYERNLTDYETLTAHIREIEGITSAVPLVEGQAMASSEWATLGVQVKGIRQEDIKTRPLIADTIREGSLEDFTGKDTIAIGLRLAEQLGVQAGENVTLISPQLTTTAIGHIPRIKTYKVAAIFEVGMYEYDSTIIYMPLEAAQLLFQYKDAASSIEIMVEDPEKVAKYHVPLLNIIDKTHRLQDWQTTNGSFFNALQVERTVMFLILTLIVIVAAFNIVSSLVMLVGDKQADIAILRTIGMTRRAVMRVFFLCGASIGVVGTILGFILGLAFALNIETIRRCLESLIGNPLFDPVIYFLSELPADVQLYDVTRVVIMALTVSFLATLYPAWKAARVHPVEALRYE